MDDIVGYCQYLSLISSAKRSVMPVSGIVGHLLIVLLRGAITNFAGFNILAFGFCAGCVASPEANERK